MHIVIEYAPLTRTVYLIGLSRFLHGDINASHTITAGGLSPRSLFSFLFFIRKMLTLTHLERFLAEQAAPRVRQKPRHTLLGRALETFQTGQSARGCAALRRLTPTKHYSLLVVSSTGFAGFGSAGPLALMIKHSA